jgi:Sigma-70 region 2
LSTPISDTRQQDLLALTPLIRRVVAARVRDPQVVDDLVQETFTRLLQPGPRLDDDALAPPEGGPQRLGPGPPHRRRRGPAQPLW